MWLPWQWAVVLAVGLAALGLLTRPVRPLWVGAAAFAREAALIAGLYSLWQLAGTLSVMQVDGALDRGPCHLGLPAGPAPAERAGRPGRRAAAQVADPGQQPVLRGRPRPALGIFLVWLFLRHRRPVPAVAQRHRHPHVRVPGHPADPGRPASAAARARLRRHGPPLRPVRLRRGGRQRQLRPALGHAVGARRLGRGHRCRRRAGEHEPVAVAGAGPPDRHGLRRRGDGQPLVARRHRRRRHPGRRHGDRAPPHRLGRRPPA